MSSFSKYRHDEVIVMISCLLLAFCSDSTLGFQTSTTSIMPGAKSVSGAGRWVRHASMESRIERDWSRTRSNDDSYNGIGNSVSSFSPARDPDSAAFADRRRRHNELGNSMMDDFDYGMDHGGIVYDDFEDYGMVGEYDEPRGGGRGYESNNYGSGASSSYATPSWVNNPNGDWKKDWTKGTRFAGMKPSTVPSSSSNYPRGTRSRRPPSYKSPSYNGYDRYNRGRRSGSYERDYAMGSRMDNRLASSAVATDFDPLAGPLDDPIMEDRLGDRWNGPRSFGGPRRYSRFPFISGKTFRTTVIFTAFILSNFIARRDPWAATLCATVHILSYGAWTGSIIYNTFVVDGWTTFRRKLMSGGVIPGDFPPRYFALSTFALLLQVSGRRIFRFC